MPATSIIRVMIPASFFLKARGWAAVVMPLAFADVGATATAS